MSALTDARKVGDAARLEADTARRYSEYEGGGDTPEGEVWAHVAYLAELTAQLAASVVRAHELGDLLAELAP